MGFIDHLELLEQIHHLIESKGTGNPEVFAARLHISEPTLYRILAELKDRGAKIAYNHHRMTYYYQNDVEIKVLFKINDNGKVIKGGQYCKVYDLLSNLRVGCFNLADDSYSGIL